MSAEKGFHRITVKAVLKDGTRMSKVIWYDPDKSAVTPIVAEFKTFLENVILRIPK